MADVGTGGSVAFGTSSFTAAWQSIEWDEVTRTVVDTTHLGTTGGMTYMPGDLHETGGVTVEIQYDPDAQPPYTTAAETVTVTYPVPSGSTNGATVEGSGFVDSFTPGGMTVDELMTATMHIKFSGSLTFTDAS